NLVWDDTGGYDLICLLYPLALVVTWRVPGLRADHLCTLLSALLLMGVPVWTGALSRYLLPVRPWIYLSVLGAAVQVVPEMIWRRNMRRGRDGERPSIPLSTEPARQLTLATAATLAALIGWGSSHPLRAFSDN